jgi:hypothetical protein
LNRFVVFAIVQIKPDGVQVRVVQGSKMCGATNEALSHVILFVSGFGNYAQNYSLSFSVALSEILSVDLNKRDTSLPP